MTAWREQKRAARRVVHDTMQIAALYYAGSGATPVPVTVRLQTKFMQIGDDRSSGWAEVEAVAPRLIFMLPDLGATVIDRNGIVLMLDPVTGATTAEAYNIDNTLPPDDITMTAEVTRLTTRQFDTAGLPTPGTAP